MKDNGEKISMLTAYDYSTAKLFDEAGIHSILVGDSLGMVMLGYDTTIPVTVDDMIHHGAAVARGAKNALVVVDMPFMSYQTSVYDAVVNAGRIMKETEATAVKLEGGKDVCPHIEAIVKASIPVVAHIGLTLNLSMLSEALRYRERVKRQPKSFWKTPSQLRQPEHLRWCWNVFLQSLPHLSQRNFIFRPSVSEPGPDVTGRSLSIRIC